MADLSHLREHIASTDQSLRLQFGTKAAPRLTFDASLRRGPHVDGSMLPADCDRTSLVTAVAEGLTPLHDLNLHACFPAAATSEAIEMLTARVDKKTGTGLGRAMRDKGGVGQSQYLIDLADPVVFAAFDALAEQQVALRTLRRVMRAVIEAPGVGSVPGVLDLMPEAGVADMRHFWLRLSSGGASDAPRPHFNTNGNPSDDAAEACWHIDNPKSPTVHPTSRLLLKIYAAGGGRSGGGSNEASKKKIAKHTADGQRVVAGGAAAGAASRVHVLEVRSAALCLRAEVPVAPGDAVLMSDVARGSSRAATTPAPFVEHRGRCPAGQWQLELLLNCVVEDAEQLRRSLRAAAAELTAEYDTEALGPSLAAAGALRVDPSSFRNLAAASKEEYRRRFLDHAAAVAPGGGVAPIPVAVPVMSSTLEPALDHGDVDSSTRTTRPVAVAVPVASDGTTAASSSSSSERAEEAHAPYSSVRPDGSLRPVVRVRAGFVPEKEMERYEAPRPARERGQLLEWTYGYGFIKPDGLGDNLFVHHTEVHSKRARELRGGEHVEYERGTSHPGQKLDRAVNVRLVDELPPPVALGRSSGVAVAAAGRSAATVKPTVAVRPTTALVPRAVAARGKRPATKAAVPAAAAEAGKKRTLPAEASVTGLW